MRNLFCAIFLSLLAACGGGHETPKSNGKLKVISTTAMIDDVVAQIGKDRIDHTSLITGEIDPHSYELVKGDDEKLKTARLVFSNGLGLEHGASLQYCIERHSNHVALGNILYQKNPNTILIRGGQIDPHIWMDMGLWSEIIDPIVEALAKASPQDAPFFTENGKALKTEMLNTHALFKNKIASIPSEKKYLVTSHDAFNYFARAYLGDDWENRSRAPEGLAPDGQLSCRDIQAIIDHLKNHSISAVFPESNISRDALRKIVLASRELGLSVEIVSEPLHADALGSKGSDADTYFKMMEHNVRVLSKAWGLDAGSGSS